MKILRIAIWLNCLVSVLLALSMMVAWMTIFNAPHNKHLFTAAAIISFICVTVIPILGVCMVVMEILSRRDRSRGSVAAGAQAESSLGPPP